MQVKEGGYYRRRDGWIVGPMEKSDLTEWPFCYMHKNYRLDGTNDFAKGVSCEIDLIAEVEVRDKLPFELKAGGKYVLDNGETVTIHASTTSSWVKCFAPFYVVSDVSKYYYCSPYGEVSGREGIAARIVSEYQEPPPTPVARLKESIKLLIECAIRKEHQALALIRGVIVELEK